VAVLAAGVVSLQLTHASRAYSQTATTGHTRVYYIAADEVRWNYAPAGSNLITGQPFGDPENTYVKQGPDRIGSDPGTWLFHCHVNDHILAGMLTRYQVA
jgi:hypothetical protein